MSEPEDTGERLLPELSAGELVHAEHVARYHLAAQLAEGRRVLDAACGEGYGTAILTAAGAESVTGVDVDEPTLARARERYEAEFVAADITALPFADDSFELVACFETIEHVPDPEAALAELARVLAPGGLLVVSTPNADEYKVENEFHVRELGHDEFLGMLGTRFESVRVLYQQNFLTSAILDEDQLREAGGERRLDLRLRKVAGTEPGRELYTVALCGDGADADVHQEAVAADVYEAHELARRLVEAERTAAHWHDEYQQMLASNRWMASTLTWRLTRPFRVVGRRIRGR